MGVSKLLALLDQFEMKRRLIELLVVMAVVINQIQFLLFSLAGIDYDPDKGSGLVAILNISFWGICLGWVCWQGLSKKASKFAVWPFFVVVFIILSFFFESLIIEDVTINSVAGRQFLFFGTNAVPAIFLAMHIYRYNRFDMVARNAEIIMLICTLALILNIPVMMSETSFQKIGGGGGHQDISYTAAFCFTINLTNILSRNRLFRYKIFLTKTFKIIYFSLLPIQAIICILGGGRGGALLLVFGFLSITYIYSRQHFGSVIRWSIPAILVFVIIVAYSEVFSEGFGRAFDYLQGGTVDLSINQSDLERTQLREQSYAIIGESPIIGYGLWNGLIVAGYYMHNVFLDILIAGGFVYLFLFILIMNKVYKTSYRILLTDNSKCMLLPYILYPSILLLFSGFYLSNSLFWFFTVLALLYRKQYRSSGRNIRL